MAESLILNRRYAKALFDLAEESGRIEELYRDMQLVAKVFYENKSLYLVMKSYSVKKGTKKNILKELFEGKVSKLALEFILFVVRKDRGRCMLGIAGAFIELYNEYRDITKAILYTKEPADEEIKERIISIVKRFTSKTIELENKIDKNLIGGFRLFFDGHLYDASLLTKFKKLNKSFSINVYDKSI